MGFEYSYSSSRPYNCNSRRLTWKWFMCSIVLLKDTKRKWEACRDVRRARRASQYFWCGVQNGTDYTDPTRELQPRIQQLRTKLHLSLGPPVGVRIRGDLAHPEDAQCHCPGHCCPRNWTNRLIWYHFEPPSIKYGTCLGFLNVRKILLQEQLQGKWFLFPSWTYILLNTEHGRAVGLWETLL
jgi:hypothetical protein